MKYLLFFAILLLFKFESTAQKSAVLVELFTYDGCLNCATSSRNIKDLFPPGDSLLAAKVVLLTYHVDYDENDGFVDPLNDKRWQDRQRQYARFGISDGIYTPQILLNGRSSFSASNRARLFREINLADTISNQPVYDIKWKFDSLGILSAAADLEEIREGLIFNFVLVKNRKISNPESGENVGRTMESRNIAIDFLSLLPKKTLNYNFRLTKGSTLEDLHLITFFQRISDGQILSLKESFFTEIKN
jgi:hypothetical protein